MAPLRVALTLDGREHGSLSLALSISLTLSLSLWLGAWACWPFVVACGYCFCTFAPYFLWLHFLFAFNDNTQQQQEEQDEEQEEQEEQRQQREATAASRAALQHCCATHSPLPPSSVPRPATRIATCIKCSRRVG